MADIAIPKASEPADAVATERVDEGRWESEGGQPVHKTQSPDAALSDLAKTSEAATADTSSTADTAAPVAATSTATSSEYDAGKVHPKTLEGKAGDASESHYPDSAQSTSSDTTATDSSSGSTLDAPAEASTGPAQPAARKKSISERLAETWQDIKHKVEDLTNKK